MWKSVFTLALLLTCLPSLAQNYPTPSKSGQAAALCDASGTGSKYCEACSGDNANKPTFQYSGPLSKFIGRLVDSSTTGIVQNKGMRTLRANKIRILPARGTAPARAYLQLGETFAAYTLSTFFEGTLKAPMIAANEIPTPHTTFPWGGRTPFERLAPFDAYFYPEHKNADWSVPLADGTDRLYDFDFDDRGNAYLAESLFGWGIVKDAAETGGKHLTSVVQVIGTENHGITPFLLFVLKAGSSAPATSKYHVFIADESKAGLVHFNATNASDPSYVTTRTPASKFVKWAKDDSERVLALLDNDGVLRLYDYDDFIGNREPLLVVNPTSGLVMKDLAFDESGVLWAIESDPRPRRPLSNLLIRKFKPVGSGYNETVITGAYPGAYAPAAVYAAGGYVAVAGSTGTSFDMQLFKVEGNGLRHLDTDDFFQKYYHAAPPGYAQPGNQNRTNNNYVYLYKHTDGKTYLFYHPNGMGDVFELEGNGLNASMLQGFGAGNPNAPEAQPGPFPGDPVSFKATSSAAGSQALQWIFGNAEAGGPVNIRSGTTGATITHYYTGLNTTSKVTTPKNVVVSLDSDSSISDTVVVNLKVPTPRIAVESSGQLITASGFKVVHGDRFLDGSDGSKEGHYAEWTIKPAAGVAVVTPATPDTEIPVGLVLGEHTVEYKGYYGKEKAPFSIDDPFVTSIPSRTYTVLPFLATMLPAQRTGNTINYDAVAQFTSDPLFLSATQWTYTWTLTTAAGAVTKTLTDTMNKGTNIPAFPVELALLEAANGGKVTLQLSVAPGGVPDAAFATFSTFVNVKLPNMTIVRSNCSNAGNDCSISATSTPASDAATWQLSWVVKRGNTTVKTGTGNPLATFRLLEAGVHNVTVTETVFGVSKSEDFTVAQTLCGPPPTSAQLTFVASCTSDCPVGQPISFTASAFPYTIQECDEFVWSFGDGGSATGLEVSHSFASNGTFTVKLTARNSSNTTGNSVTQQIKVGQVVTPTCTAPSNATFTTNCVSGSTCKTGNSIVFTARRSGAALQTCDSVQWTFGDGGTSNEDRPTHAYSAAGTYPITVKITNQFGSTPVFNGSVTVVPNVTTEPCSGGPSAANITMSYDGNTSGCASTNSTNCETGETIGFSASFFGYALQNCDKFEWNFGDNTPVSTAQQSSHTYTTNGIYTVKLKIYNTSRPNGVTVEQSIVVGPKVPAKVVPILAFVQFPIAGSTGVPVTFTVNVTNNVDATGWSWDFGDGTKDTTSQKDIVGNSISIQHTYTKVGTFPVSVKARNAEDLPSAQTGQALGAPGIAITDVPEYKYLLPVVTNGGPWRTDVQIYTPDPNVSPQTPLQMHATLRDIPATLEIRNSTQTYEDFVKTVFSRTNDFGPVIITVRTKVAPQIWTRTYNQTENGTYGQFIPAIRIDAAAGAGSAFGSGKYYLAGLRNGARFRTNLGFVNPNPQPVNVTVKVYDDTQTQVGQFPLLLQPYQLEQFPITHAKGVPNLSREHPFSLQIVVPTGQWLIAYASYIDNGSDDPVYFQAVRESDLSSVDNANLVIPGVGHVGEWRSDVTIFNPDAETVTVDLAYHDQSGAEVAKAKGVQIRSHEFVQYTDILKQGVFSSVSDSIGILRVTVTSTFPPAVYPLTFARTYNDKGTGKTFGQGISGFAAARANVKPGKPALVAGIRSNSKYYTNVGVVNVSTIPAAVTVKLLDPASGAEHVLQTFTLQPNQSVVGRVALPNQLETGSLKIEVTGGNAWAFCSIVDVVTADPEYVAATPLAQ
ncbi:MAG TPA: PKD domain-containing protein [Thermoanaerobaculia bacterium]|nr:PKD domain-containing protein [Thermoanaerobaculia bacterium]